MHKLSFSGVVVLLILTLLMSGCGQNKIVGTWATEKALGVTPIFTIKQQDDKTFVITMSVLQGTGEGDAATLKEGKPLEWIGTMNNKDDAVIQVQANGIGNNNISYNKEKDVIITMLGMSKVTELRRVKDDKEMQEIREKALDSYKTALTNSSKKK